MKATFSNTVDILVKAYLDGTLEHGNCAACAVGNIIAGSIGAKVSKDSGNWSRGGDLIIPIWAEVFITSAPFTQEQHPKKYIGQVRRQIEASGYEWKDLAKIEAAFESQSCGIDADLASEKEELQMIDEAMFNGLMAVVDVLAEIHNVDLTVKENAKLLFVKP